MTDIEELQRWVGRSERCEMFLDPWQARALAATLGNAVEFAGGDPLPLPWHWLFLKEATPRAALGEDGHARRGDFLPPVTLPRRMWAGGSITCHRAPRLGEAATRISRIAGITPKQGRSGALVFVRVHHQWRGADGKPCIDEDQEILYREGPRPHEPASPGLAPPAPAQWSREIRPDPLLLFRYSALTFNGHRIHYDRGYCREVEGYPGLVVHGPLTATLLLELLREQRPEARVKRFEYRALHPLFDIHPFSVHGALEAPESALLWALDRQGALAMRATADLG